MNMRNGPVYTYKVRIFSVAYLALSITETIESTQIMPNRYNGNDTSQRRLASYFAIEYVMQLNMNVVY